MYQTGDAVRIANVSDFAFAGRIATVSREMGSMSYAGRSWALFALTIDSEPGEWCVLPACAFTLVECETNYL